MNTTHRIQYSDNIKDIMLQIQHIMLDKGLRQKDICNVTGWSNQTVSNLLACRTPNPSLRVLITLINAIGCTLYIDIVDNTDNTET